MRFSLAGPVKLKRIFEKCSLAVILEKQRCYAINNRRFPDEYQIAIAHKLSHPFPQDSEEAGGGGGNESARRDCGKRRINVALEDERDYIRTNSDCEIYFHKVGVVRLLAALARPTSLIVHLKSLFF